MDTTPNVPSRKRKTMPGSSLESPIGRINPMRMSSIGLVTSTPVVFQTNDDEAERRNWKHLSTLQQEPESAKRTESIPLNTLEEFLGNWVRMSVENKINAKNVWKIHIIDYLRILVDKNTENPLQLATASLTASAKVYSLRVDDVYTEVIRLAGSLGHRGNQNNEHDVDEDGAGHQAEGNDMEASQSVRIKRKKKGKSKTTTNPGALVGDIDLLDTAHPIFAELNTRSGDIIGTDNMFQVFVPLNSLTSEYDIRINEKFFDCEIVKRTDPAAMELDEDTKKLILPITLQSPNIIINTLKICSTFSEFSLTNWSLDEEEALNSQQNQTIIPSTADQINLAFDINAEPQSIMDVTMEDAGNPGNYNSDEEVVQEANIEPNFPTALAGCKPQIENIVDMRPSHPNHTRNLEYSYNSIVSGIWAGPAHWKIKSIVHRTQPRMTMQRSATVAEANTKKKTSKQKIFEVPFEEVPEEEEEEDEEESTMIKPFLKCSENKLKMTTIYTWDKNKNELPIDLHITCADTLKLFLNKTWSLVRQERPASTLSIENNQYDYNNLNDSAFCNPPDPELLDKSNDIEHEYSDHEVDHGDNMFTGVEHGEEVDMMLTGDNLLPAPRIIPKLFVPYSTRAKKVNMKAIKQAMWDIITKSTDEENDENLNTEANKKDATETKFSTIIEKLPGLLPRDQAANISIALSFFGLLHLANENSLKLTGNDELTDVDINKG
ncbi:condensin complex subunit 2-like isoform X2 [Chrysoperla carnea]|uniref:condensin complex subunit 2-like isoform X2 n=1 Tax=Chrysoperla carnea TaxID=189513 RepID=UPI001D073E13|nr:condensin complex subunit 2-like isoform X2 [Chrysoperla carnea]